MRLKLSDIPLQTSRESLMLQGRQGNVRTFSSGHPCTTTTRETSQRGWMLSKQKGYWKHETHPISFTLCVDDFGVKYVGEEHFQHLRTSLNKHYETSIDTAGTRYLGLIWTGTTKTRKDICLCWTMSMTLLYNINT